MNNHITRLYSLTLHGEVIIIETNFSKFYDKLDELIPSSRSDKTYINKFKEQNEFWELIDGEPYYFQRLI